MIDYAAEIRMVRAFLNISRQELGDMVGVTRFSIRNYELGNTVPAVDVWHKIMQLKEGANPGEHNANKPQ